MTFYSLGDAAKLVIAHTNDVHARISQAEVTGGYQKLYVDHVMQADKGADLDFLVGRRGSVVKRHSH